MRQAGTASSPHTFVRFYSLDLGRVIGSCNWDVRAGDVTNQEAIKPAQTKLSLA